MYLTIQEIAERTGVSAYTIRYYEKIGVLPGIQRATNGRRRFTAADVRTLRLISDYKKAGLSLEEIATIMDEIIRHGCILQQTGSDDIAEQSFAKRLTLLREHRERLIEQRAHLDRALAALDQKIELYERHSFERQIVQQSKEMVGQKQ